MSRSRTDFRVGDIVRFAKLYRFPGNAQSRFCILAVRNGRVDVARASDANDITLGLSPAIFEMAGEWDD